MGKVSRKKFFLSAEKKKKCLTETQRFSQKSKKLFFQKSPKKRYDYSWGGDTFKTIKKNIFFLAYFESLNTSEHYAANRIQKLTLVLEA